MTRLASCLSFISMYLRSLSAQPELCHFATKSKWDKWKVLSSTQHIEAHSHGGKISVTSSEL